jgi:hypothetical protein
MNSIGSLSFTREFKGYIFGSVKGKTLTVFALKNKTIINKEEEKCL